MPTRTAFAHTLDGRLGSATRLLESRLPFTLKPKTPLEVTASDRIDLPLAIANNTDQARQVQLLLAQVELAHGDGEVGFFHVGRMVLGTDGKHLVVHGHRLGVSADVSGRRDPGAARHRRVPVGARLCRDHVDVECLHSFYR